MLVSPGSIKIWIQANQAMGRRPRLTRPPAAIAIARDRVDLKRGGGIPPPQGPNPITKYIQLALGSSSLLAGALLSILTGTSAGLIFVPPALILFARAFK